jgi:hypothetical protein
MGCLSAQTGKERVSKPTGTFSFTKQQSFTLQNNKTGLTLIMTLNWTVAVPVDLTLVTSRPWPTAGNLASVNSAGLPARKENHIRLPSPKLIVCVFSVDNLLHIWREYIPYCTSFGTYTEADIFLSQDDFFGVEQKVSKYV